MTATPITPTPLPLTLMQMKKADLTPPSLADSLLVIIDAQGEYRAGPLALPGVDAAVAEAKTLLERARASATPVIHVVHQGQPGSLFDLDGPGGAILPELTPRPDEPVIRKTKASAFAGTALADIVAASGRRTLILVGFMTHNCVAATAHAAAALGYGVTVVASASGTRALPQPDGTALAADALHQATLAGLSDTIARIACTQDVISDQ